MDETEFLKIARAEMLLIENVLESVCARLDFDCDVQVSEGSVLDVALPNGSKLVLNLNVAAREIWLAARTGAFHFRCQEGIWRDTRSRAELRGTLIALLSELSGGEFQIFLDDFAR